MPSKSKAKISTVSQRLPFREQRCRSGRDEARTGAKVKVKVKVESEAEVERTKQAVGVYPHKEARWG